ncbi:MAG: PAS domain-containing protein [Eubacteriaceae bacterium]
MNSEIGNLFLGETVFIILGVCLSLLLIKIHFKETAKRIGIDLERSEIIQGMFNALIDNVSDCVIIIDDAGVIINANSSFVKYYNRPLDRIIGKNIQRIPTDYDHSEHMDKLREGIKNNNYYEFEVNYFSENGEIIPFQMKIVSFLSKQGKLFGLVGSDKKAIREKNEFIFQLEKELLEIQDLGHLGYWEINNLTKKVYWSKELYSILGYKDKEIPPDLSIIYTMVHIDDRERVNRAFCLSFQTQKKGDIKHRLINKLGETITVDLRIRHLFSENNDYLGAIGILQKIDEWVDVQ